MDTLMKVAGRAWKKRWIGAICLLLAVQVGVAQKKPANNGTADQTRMVLVGKAHALEARGRPDMAIQLWQQILLSDPNNTEALAGLAKDYKLIGSSAQADEALARLKKVNPNDPNIAKISALTSTRVQSDRLREAGELARQGKTDAAMNIYRELYGDRPPDGDIALAYYQTLYGTPLGKEAAVAAMRALAQRNPGDTRFAVELGRMLTYDAKNRAEGIRILRQYPKDSLAQEALRQALVWDSANPNATGELREYLKEHPQDTELAGKLKEDESKLAQMNSGIARTPEERAAFAALNAHKLEQAQTLFTAILQKDPGNGRAAAGMGFLRMQQSNFGGAISYLTQAEQNGYKARAVEDGLVTSRFWYTMGEASQAFDDNQMDVATAKYRAALAMRPRSPEALNGLAGILVKEQQYPAAAGVYEQLLKIQPHSADVWRGLFLAYARDGQNKKAIAVSARFPVPVKATLAKDPEYLRTLATIYQAENRNADAQRVLAQALALPFPDNGTSLKADTRLQYAGILMEAKRYGQAAELYTQILNDDAGNLSAWMGLVSAHHELGEDNQAIADVEKMPPATYDSALADPGFLSMLGSIYAQANQFEIAQGLLERSAKIQIAAGGKPDVALELQMAAIYMQRNNTAQAYEIYRQVLQAHPDRVDAWKGLIATLLQTNRNSEALAEIALIPAAVRKQLETDIEFVQTEASLLAATGDTARATEYMNRVEAHYATLKTQPPANIDIQNAWLLFNTGNDRALYTALMRLGSRADLTVAQRETVQDIWANWSVRRAGVAMDNGNISRAVDILDAASQAFPNNLAVRKAVAGGYARVGRSKESMALFKSIPMQDATVGDFQAAINAALAANDKSQAEIWLRQALERFPQNPAILSLAARYEQSRGDNQRAADYWRASLAAMPQASPADRLAHELVYPEQDTKARRAVTAADLAHLLDPNYEPFAKTTKVAPLPAYGKDPYAPGAPVDLSQPQPAQQQPPAVQQQTQQPLPWAAAPAATEQAPFSSTAGSNSAFAAVPQTQASPYGQFNSEQNAAQAAGEQLSSPQTARIPSKARSTQNQLSYEGSMHVPGGGSVASAPVVAPAVEAAQQAYTPTPQGTVQQALNPDQANGQAAQAAAPVVHTMVADAYKGLIFSLQANNKTAEAFQEIAQMPPDVRQQLETDVEYMQAVASLYVVSGDIPHAMEYLNRVENYYLVRRAVPPAGIQVQDAWLLFNAGDDHRLYPVLRSLDVRRDLTAAQRDQVQNIWANWSLRRATAAMDNGNTLLAVDILEAAAESFPDNLTVRRALAGGYVKVGRASDSLEIFKATSMQDANAGDFQGAVGAAMVAKDMAQAEAWLRLALERFPQDPGVLASAARFEQARGNNERATDFWRAALAAMPPGSNNHRLDALGVYPPEDASARRRAAATANDLKLLLDPDNRQLPSPVRQPALPAYGTSPNNRTAPNTYTPPAPASQPSPPPYQWNNGPTSTLLPLPVPQALNQGHTASSPQANSPAAVPVYIPKQGNPLNGPPGTQPSQPIFIEQSATQAANIGPADNTSANGKQARPAANPKDAVNRYAGRMQPSPSDLTFNGTDSVATGTRGIDPELRITSAPADSAAAKAQALFAEQTDAQLTQGSAIAIHTLGNAPVSTPPSPAPALSATPRESGQYRMAQYTPSAQEAATGAYSAPKQQQQPTPQLMPDQQPAPQPQAQQVAQQAPPPPRKLSKKARRAAAAAAQHPAPTLATIPAPQELQPVQVPDLPVQGTQTTTTTGLSDQELQDRNLPPLRGPWVRVKREERAPSPRDEAEMQLRSIESGYSAWMGGAGVINYRSGDLGFDHLSALEAPFEASLPLGYHSRFTIVAKPVFLDSGQADGNSVIQVTTLGQTALKQIPQPLGTLMTTDTTPPPQQNATGLAGELQLAFPHLALAGGYTPAGFLVATFTARAMFKPGNGPFTFNFVRDAVKDTQLSYSGLRDPGSASLSFPGNIWGGVVANQFSGQYARGDAESGFYMGAGGQYLTGYNVEHNARVDGSGGAYWRLLTQPEYGNLSIGVNFFGMHYSHNEDAFTYGMGGYFSPQAYFLANVPFTWAGHSGTRWHYNVMGSLGVQAFQESLTKLFPLVGQTSLEVSSGNLALPAKTSVGPNYDLRGNVAYQIGSHWFAGGFVSANNSRNYSSASAGFFVRYLFRSQPSTVAGPTGLFPTEGFRPFTVP
jgi:tetratricopeptide (TPR) repeat protein